MQHSTIRCNIISRLGIAKYFTLIFQTQYMEGYLSALSLQEETLHYSTRRLALPSPADLHQQWSILTPIFTLLHLINSHLQTAMSGMRILLRV